jgi:hypothetical protein
MAYVPTLDVWSCAMRESSGHLLGSVREHMIGRLGLGWDARHGTCVDTGCASNAILLVEQRWSQLINLCPPAITPSG